ncbi:MAG: substrate binding domain-containing protein [Serratia liquefaciens]|jgi:DNA-binding transcriptional LysR family regulator|nr:substrate binding domain-containing protein [Serratia liquefaciens]MCH4231592.1 substrate binding domain-containing protein [Serratia liquefaciens]MCH4261499.1 substrate binding domain-containing protein [Serratia liquefaciens]MCI1214032.1 substrate binding domain-containing protein [Serratia liquefaciens]MCI1235385.1 substrate binding domain-containing protein [Serratia liquefaciens]
MASSAFFQPGAVETRAADRFKTYALEIRRSSKHLRLFEERDHVGLIEQVVLRFAGNLQAFLRRYPKVDVRLRLEDRYMDLIDDRVDLALRITERPSPGLIGRQLMTIDHLLCATPAYLAQQGTPQHPQDLALHSCIYLGETPNDARWKFRQAGKTVTVNVRGRYAANHTGVRLDAVKQHIGIGSLPYFTARQALDDGEVVQVLPQWDFLSSYHGGLWLLYAPNQYLPPKLRVFIDYLVACLAKEPQLKRLA